MKNAAQALGGSKPGDACSPNKKIGSRKKEKGSLRWINVERQGDESIEASVADEPGFGKRQDLTNSQVSMIIDD
jgi:hypothetical protein